MHLLPNLQGDAVVLSSAHASLEAGAEWGRVWQLRLYGEAKVSQDSLL